MLFVLSSLLLQQLPRWKLITVPKNCCPDLRWEGNIETGPFQLNTPDLMDELNWIY